MGLEIPSELPILPLQDTVVYPLTMMPLNIGQPHVINLINEVVVKQPRVIGLVAMKEGAKEAGNSNNLYSIGTVAVIQRLFHAPDNTMRLIVQGIDRIRIKKFITSDPYLKAAIEVYKELAYKDKEIEALMRNTIELLRKLTALAPHLPEELLPLALNIEDPRQLVYVVASGFRVGLQDAQEILELNSIEQKLTKLNALLTKEVEILELGKRIQLQAQLQLDKTQREYILREQLKQIKKEVRAKKVKERSRLRNMRKN